MTTSHPIRVTRISSTPKPESYSTLHHVGNPPTSFKNPWPSFPSSSIGFLLIIHKRFFNSSGKNYVPVPANREGLVEVIKPDWGVSRDGLKATWIGHASFLVETSCRDGGSRGVRILLDPVFSTRMSPFSFIGPKRFTPPPCELKELPVVDVVVISHDHYDHLDAPTIKFIHQRGNGAVRFVCGLGVGRHLMGMGVLENEISEMDWWDGIEIEIAGVGAVKVVCTPSQHNSGRTGIDMGRSLWCSYVIEEHLGNEIKRGIEKSVTSGDSGFGRKGKKLYFAGDTAYRAIPDSHPEPLTNAYLSTLPACPSFAQVGSLYGPFDLALLPIGCYSPRSWMSAVHCSPEDSICIHKDIRSKFSVGMHYGTVRGGISQYYEEVTEPPRLWKQACEDTGLIWEKEIATCAIGETVVV